MSKALFIDISRCSGCNNCFLACKDEHCGNDFYPYTRAQPNHGQRWIDVSCRERGSFPKIKVAYLPKPCMHCAKPECGAVPRKDGITLFDPEKSKGNRDAVTACPYGFAWYNEELDMPQKCTMCAHLLDSGWKEPRCVSACPDGALRYLDPADMDMQEWLTLCPEHGTLPNVYYKNLYLYDSNFVTGTAVRSGECLEQALLMLEDRKAYTDAFGSFMFDGLSNGRYTLKAEYGGISHSIEFEIADSSVDIGDICFENSVE